MTAFKEYYNERSMTVLAGHICKVWPAFPRSDFLQGADALHALELKARVEFIAQALIRCLPTDYPELAQILHATMDAVEIVDTEEDSEDGWKLSKGEATLQGFSMWPLTRLVSLVGLDDFARSMGLLKAMTRRFTAEFDVRFFLLQDQERTLQTLKTWTQDPNPHVRRLCSEGTRPRLPWAQALPALRDDPTLGLALLEDLKYDDSLYVRRSVANHLNDVSVVHPELVVEVLERWLKASPQPKETRWMANHASRTMLKKGHPGALRLAGFDPDVKAQVTSLKLEREEVPWGEKLVFVATLRSEETREVSVMLDYAVHYMKANGTLKPKVFKGAKIKLGPGEEVVVRRGRSMKETSVRKHYPGAHRLEIFLNGQSRALCDWALTR